eukprot:TRINITY_DN2562_c0_g1_i5.p1 TRINITY_DN2562_c0_g1~~TRINITY_DN2562_c0_g1_i5.p1  ORF type:complete len:489 (+),score=86.49 TRINITY_DN2562_c0_g1_i5:62-1468(+)
MTCLKPSIWVIFPVLVCEFLSYAIVNPSITPILVEYFGGNFSRAALITGLVDGLGAFLTLFSSPVYGALSDQYGRKPFLLLSVFGCSFIPACFVFGLPIPVYLGLKFATNLFLNQDFGIFLSYASDITKPEERATTFGFVLAATGVSFVGGPLLAIFISRHWGAVVSLSLIIVAFFYVLFLVPESLGYRKRIEEMKDEEAGSKPVVGGSSLQFEGGHEVPKNPFAAMKFLLRSPLLTLLAIMLFFSELSENGLLDTALLYLNDRFHYTSQQNSFLLIGFGVGFFLTTFFIYPLCIKHLNIRTLIIFALFCNLAHVICYIILWNFLSIILVIGLLALAFMAFPAIGAVTSLHVPPHMQGRAQGGIAGVRAVTRGFGPLIFSGIFSYFTSSHSPISNFPQAAFVFGAICVFISLLFAFRLPHVIPKMEEDEETDINTSENKGENSETDREKLRKGSYGRVENEDAQARLI